MVLARHIMSVRQIVVRNDHPPPPVRPARDQVLFPQKIDELPRMEAVRAQPRPLNLVGHRRERAPHRRGGAPCGLVGGRQELEQGRLRGLDRRRRARPDRDGANRHARCPGAGARRGRGARLRPPDLTGLGRDPDLPRFDQPQDAGDFREGAALAVGAKDRLFALHRRYSIPRRAEHRMAVIRRNIVGG